MYKAIIQITEIIETFFSIISVINEILIDERMVSIVSEFHKGNLKNFVPTKHQCTDFLSFQNYLVDCKSEDFISLSLCSGSSIPNRVTLDEFF